MNNARRKAIVQVMNDLELLQSDYETIRDEEQEVFDAMPESLQESERGHTAQAALENMESALEWFETVADMPDVDDCVSALDSARE